MGACRESQDIFFFIKIKNYKRVWYLIKNFDKVTYGDTFGPIICKIKGHNAYQPDKRYEPKEWACKRCHKYIKYNPRLEKLKKLNKLSK
jgi:hypothetical protein